VNLLQTLRMALGRDHASGSETARPSLRRAPACEALEGRQLLNTAWGPPKGFAGWDGPLAAPPGVPGQVHQFRFDGAPGGAHAFKGGGGHKGFGGHALTPPSPQLKADFQALETDEKTLRAEIPASVTAAVQADRTVIEQAFSKMAPAHVMGLHPGGPKGAPPSGDPTANLAAGLTAAGVSSDKANAIVADLQALKTAMTTTDPALQAKIAADQAAIAKDGGPSFPADGPGMRGLF
jgi:hypothetical protein